MIDLTDTFLWPPPTESRETTANHVPDVPQKIRARFKAQNPGSGMPPFIRVETENTSPEYRLANRDPDAAVVAAASSNDSAAQPASFEGSHPEVYHEGASLDRRGPPPPHRRPMDGGRGRGGRRGSGGRFNDRPPRGSPRGPRPEFRRASSSSFDSPRGEAAPRAYGGPYEGQVPEPPLTHGRDERDPQAQEAQDSPTAGGLKRGYSDVSANGSSRGYDLDSSPNTRQKFN